MSDSRRLAQELYEIRALALSHATSPQLGVSSVDGEGLVLRDGDGNDLGRIGGGENGMEVEYLYGPKPPQPSAPDVSADTNLISVRWDGLWADQSETDPDIVGSPVLDRVEVHVSSDENFVPDQIESLAGTMPVLDSGGQILVGPLAEAGDWYVVLLARGKDGQYGAPSDRVHVVTSVGLVENELFGLALRAGEAMESADGKNSVYYGDTEPEPQPRLDEDGEPVLDDDGNPLFNEFSEGDIWFGEGNMPHVWSDTDGWVSAADERVDAIQSVVDELEGDLDAVRESADGKSRTFYRPTEPPALESSEGDLWFDTSAEGGNMPHRFTDGAWVPVADQRVQAIQDAQDALEADIDSVRTSVDGKSRITQSVDAPPSQYDGAVGDRWERMSSMGSGGSLISNWRWNGDVWVSTIISDAVLGNVDAAKIGTGYLDAQRIKAGTIAADRLVVGISQNLVVDSKFKNAEINAARANNGSRNTWDVVESGAETWFRSKAGVSITSRFFYLTTDGTSTNPVTRISVDPTSVWHMSVEVSISSSAQAITHLAASCVAYSADGTARFLTKDFTRSDTGGRRINPGEGWVRLEATYDWSEYDGVVTVAPRVYVVSGGGGPDGWTWFRNPFVGEKTGSTLIEDGAITTEKIAAGSITAESGVIGSVDAGKITVGEMDGARIKAGTVTADKILVGGAGNLLTNPGFVGGGAGWSLSSYNPQIATSGGPTGEPVLSIQHSDPNSAVFPYLGGLVQSAAGSFAPDLAAVEAGKRYSASVWVRADVDIPVGNAGMGFRLRELGSATLGWAAPGVATNRTVIPANTWAKVEGDFVVPTDTGTWNRLAFGLRANGALNGKRVEFSAPVLLPKVGATLIEDGAITAEKIAVGAVTTEKITAGGIDAGVITTGELRGELIRAQSIAASALAATAIDGKTITGATVRTAAAGARVEMNSSGLYVKNQFGINTVSMQNGAISVEGGTITGGTVRTSASGARVQLDRTGLKAYNPDGDETFSISSNTGTVDMEGNLRQTNTYGRLDVGPTVFASGADGRGAPGIGFSRHSKPSGVANQAGMALREPSDGTGSFFQVQSEGGDAGWSFLNLATPGASTSTGLYRVFSGDLRSYIQFQDNGGAYLSTRQPSGSGDIWAQAYVDGRSHSQARFSLQNSGRAFISTYVGSNPDARTGMLDLGPTATWLTAGAGNTATAARDLYLTAYGDTYMSAYGAGNDPSRDAWVYAQRGGSVGLRGGTSGSDRGSWIGITSEGQATVRSRGDDIWLSRQNGSGSSTWSSISLTSSGISLNISSSTSYGIYMNTLPVNSGATPVGRSNGQLYSISSSRKYKLVEEPIDDRVADFEDKLLSIEAKTWVDKVAAERLAEYYTEVEAGVEPSRNLDDLAHVNRIPGVIAEDLADAGLDMFVHYEDGEPESVLYDRIGPALIPVVRRLRDRVNELEDKIGELWNG